MKEDFCGVCAAVPIALAGLGGTAYVSTTNEEKKRNKIIILLVCYVILAFSIFFLIKYDKCAKCNVPS